MPFPPVQRSVLEPATRLFRLLAAIAALAAVGCSSPAKPTPPDAPTIACPLAVDSMSPDGKPMPVSFATPTATAGAPPVTVSCAPASGSAFPVGITTVTCTARDSLSRLGTCSFSVEVKVQPRLKALAFLAFGDSLTEGKVSAAGSLGPLVDSPTSYPAHLQGLLRARYTAQTPTVTSAAKAGERATEGVLRLPLELSRYRPEAVLLLEGANDLYKADPAIVAAAAKAVREMVQDTVRAGAVAFLATLPPQRPGTSKTAGAAYVPAYNDMLRTVALQEGAVLVDVWTAFGGEAALTATPGLIGADGLHLTEEGYKKLGETFYEEIRKRLEVQPAPAASAHPLFVPPY